MNREDSSTLLPKVLVIDDLAGRRLKDHVANEDRIALCASLLLKDVHEAPGGHAGLVKNPIASAEFVRGQKPVESRVGDVVENDPEGTLLRVREGWTTAMERGEPPWALVLLDIRFYTGEVTEASHRLKAGTPARQKSDEHPDRYFGWTLLDMIHSRFPELPVFMLSAMSRDEVSLEFSRRGALGFIDRDDLKGPELLQEALHQHGLLPDLTGEIVGNSMQILLALREARRAARHRENMLIQGERGTGKELIASYVHRMGTSSRGGQDSPFVTVNSALFTPSLFASELFGIQPRTATGVDGKIGLIESANKGDLFFDEIADMPNEAQAAMLRVLQERRIARVGSRETKDVDVRFLSATNTDLESDSRNFRPDLLDRLRLGGTIWLPPLRDRPNDIPLLTEKFVREAESQRKGAMNRKVTAEVVEIFRSHDWLGNIRELRSVVFDAVNSHPDVEHLVPAHLRTSLGSHRRLAGSVRPVSEATISKSNPTPSDPGEFEQLRFAQLIDVMSRFDFNSADREAWAGKFSQIQIAIARLLARYIKAALTANRKPTPENTAGEILIHPAMKLLTGDRKLTASKAADLIKKYLNVSPAVRDEILRDEVLREAYEIAVKLRPTTGQANPPDRYRRQS